MRHFDCKYLQHPLIPTRSKYSWVEITHKHGAGQITEGPYVTRTQTAMEAAMGEEMSNFIRAQLGRPRVF